MKKILFLIIIVFFATSCAEKEFNTWKNTEIDNTKQTIQVKIQEITEAIRKKIIIEIQSSIEKAKQNGKTSLVTMYEEKLVYIKNSKNIQDILNKYPDLARYFQ